MKSDGLETLIENWIKAMSNEETVPADIKALNFGMFEAENGYVIHLYGSEEYSPKDDSWSYNEDYVPKRRCLEIEDTDINSLYWEDLQSLVVKALRGLVKSAEQEGYKILDVSNITTGFDDGDLITIK